MRPHGQPHEVLVGQVGRAPHLLVTAANRYHSTQFNTLGFLDLIVNMLILVYEVRDDKINVLSGEPSERVSEPLDLHTGHYEVVQGHPGVPLVVLRQQVLEHGNALGRRERG